MNQSWTFGKKIAAGFVVSSVLLIIIGAVAHQSIDQLISTSYWVTHTHQVLEKATGLLGASRMPRPGSAVT